MAANIIPTTYPMLGGGDAVAGVGGTSTLTVSNTWATGDTFVVSLTNVITGITDALGYGTISGSTPTFVMTYRNKVNILFGSMWAFSEVALPTSFNNLEGTGNGYVSLSDAYSESDSAQAIVPYQGRLAVLSKNSIQIWQIDTDPAAYQLLQILENVGTFAKLSAIAFGELDVFFAHRTGIRSLRVRDASNNAYLSDVGSPVDFLFQASIAAATTIQQGAACGVMEPNTSQYWCFLYDTLYVLSYFPQMKINAWSTYKATYQAADLATVRLDPGLTSTYYIKIALSNNVSQAIFTSAVAAPGSDTAVPRGTYVFIVDAVSGATVGSSAITGGLPFRGLIFYNGTFGFADNQTTFVPQKFVVYNGQVIARSVEGFYVYGGADRATYDNTICAWETSWLDADQPANVKQVREMDAAQTGTWDYYGSIDYLGGVLEQVLSSQATPTFMGGRIMLSMQGTHMKMRGQTTGVAAKAVLSNLLFHYKLTNVK